MEKTKEQLLKEIKEFEDKRKQEIQQDDIKMKQKGFTHKTDFWIHPIAGGDDYQQTLFSIGEPTSTRISNILKKSAVKTDYRTIKL